MLPRPQVLYYALLKHSTVEVDEEHVIDQAIDRLSSVTETLAEVSTEVQAACLMNTVQAFRCQASHEVQQRLQEARRSTRVGSKSSEGKALGQVMLARALEASAVCYAMQRFVKQYSRALEGKLSPSQALRGLLQSQGEKVLGGVARNIDLFREQYVNRTLETQGVLLWLLHCRQELPSLYKAFSGTQNRHAAARRAISRFRTVSMSLEGSEPTPKTVTVTSMLQGRRAFSMEVHAGRDANFKG